MFVDGFGMHVLVHFNDLYFLDARADYSQPEGLLLPRLATVVRLLRKHFGERVTVCVPGDFMAPSCLGKHTGGEHMIDILNRMGVDFVVFGNHEFEGQAPFSSARLADYIERYKFRWLCANLEQRAPELESVFVGNDKVKLFHSIPLARGLHLVLFGVTLPGRYRGYGVAADPVEASRAALDAARDHLAATRRNSVDAVFVALTHQDLADDVRLRAACPELFLVMGGHDHDEEYAKGERAPVVKALSNLRTVRFHILLYRRRDTASADELSEQERDRLWQLARLRLLNRIFDTLTYDAVDQADPAIQELVVPRGDRGPFVPTESSAKAFIDDVRAREGFTVIGNHEVGLVSHALNTSHPAFVDGIPETKSIRQRISYWQRQAPESRTPLFVVPYPFDARDAALRKGSTNLGNLAADAVRSDPRDGATIAEIALLNAGALRIDREIVRGEAISARTICDILFFENIVQVYTLTADALWGILRLSLGLRNRGGAEGHGDFLQISGLRVTTNAGGIDRVFRTDHRSFETELPPGPQEYRVGTLDYVASRSTYRDFFEHPPLRLADYSESFTAAITRLGATTDWREWSLALYAVHNSRWLSAASYRDVFAGREAQGADTTRSPC